MTKTAAANERPPAPRPDPRPARTEQRRQARRILGRGLVYLALSLIGFTMVLPFVWSLSTSLKTGAGAVEMPPTWVPRQTATHADYQGRSYRVRVLKATATVRRHDTGEQLDVYAQALQTTRAYFGLGRQATTTVPVIVANQLTRTPVDVISTTTRVRILDDGPDQYRVLDLPAASVHERSWVSLRYQNYAEAWSKLPFGRSFVNTAIVAVSITFGQVLTSSLAAFAFARLRFPGRDKLFFAYLATMMIPGAVTLIPVYALFIKLPELLNAVFHTTWFSRDLYLFGQFYMGRLLGGNSYFALIAPGLFSAYGTFMLRQFFMGLPRELEDAARIDGCGNLRIYWHVTLPLAKVALATLATFTFMWAWKAFMWPLLILNTEELLPLQVLLQRFQGQHGAEYNLLMAGSVIVLLPLLVVFLLGQRYFIKGIQLGALKG